MRLRIKRKKDILKSLENILFCIIVMQGMGAPGTFSLLLPSVVSSSWYAMNAFAFLALAALIVYRSMGKLARVYLPVLLFGTYVLFSGMFVSGLSQDVLENSSKLLLTMVCSVYIGSTRKKEETVRIITTAQIIATLLIVYMILIGYGGVAVADSSYSFNLIGLYTTKNSCGYELVFGALLFYYCFRNRTGFWRKLFWLALFCGQFILSTLARTVGATATGICVILLYEVLIRRKRSIDLSKFYLGINAAFWVFVGFVLPSMEFILKKLGKGVTLTGRTIIWKAIVTFVSGIHRLFGYGYGGFWSNEKYTESLYAIYNQLSLRSGLVGGHNLFMELYINIGIIGIVLFIIMVHSIMNKSRQFSVQEMGFEVVCVSFLAIRGLVERTLNSNTYDTMALFVVLGTIMYTVMSKKRAHQDEEASIENEQKE